MKSDNVYLVVSREINRFPSIKDSDRKRIMAVLRRGAGCDPMDAAQAYTQVLGHMPPDMYGNGWMTKEELACYHAMTLWALHQRGKDINREKMHEEGAGLGTAFGRLIRAGRYSEQNVLRRFTAMTGQADVTIFAGELARMIPLFAKTEIGIDYGMLARDFFFWQSEDGRTATIRRWIRELSRTRDLNEKEETETDDEHKEEE